MPVEVRGLKELQNAFRLLDKSLKRELQKELRQIAIPAAERARSKAQAKHLSRKVVSGIRPGSRVGCAIVRQIHSKKTTGKHPTFGDWQVARILEPAAAETMPEAEARLAAMLDRIADEF